MSYKSYKSYKSYNSVSVEIRQNPNLVTPAESFTVMLLLTAVKLIHLLIVKTDPTYQRKSAGSRQRNCLKQSNDERKHQKQKIYMRKKNYKPKRLTIQTFPGVSHQDWTRCPSNYYFRRTGAELASGYQIDHTWSSSIQGSSSGTNIKQNERRIEKVGKVVEKCLNVFNFPRKIIWKNN